MCAGQGHAPRHCAKGEWGFEGKEQSEWLCIIHPPLFRHVSCCWARWSWLYWRRLEYSHVKEGKRQQMQRVGRKIQCSWLINWWVILDWESSFIVHCIDLIMVLLQCEGVDICGRRLTIIFGSRCWLKLYIHWQTFVQMLWWANSRTACRNAYQTFLHVS